jgi:hypothetical protein
MILLDKPLISDLLKNTIRQGIIPAFDSGDVITPGELPLQDEKALIASFKENPAQRLHTTSENAIGWIDEKLHFTGLPQKISLFKNKVAFRKLTQDMFPGFFFHEVIFEGLDKLDISGFPFPFIIKPAIGFFSMGVHKVNDKNAWKDVKTLIQSEVNDIQAIYPTAVLDTRSFIIEAVIEGEEYAVDAYYDDHGKPVIVGIMKHLFAGAEDVSDRVYITSRKIILETLKTFDDFLNDIGKRAGLKNFSLHVEVRIDEKGKLLPIEVNPLRFGAWCTSADLAHYAFGINSYAAYINNQIPDWESILSGGDDCIYSIIILDNSTGYQTKNIASFDYEKFLSGFSHPLELRKIDYHRYPIFAFLFVRTEEKELEEIEKILHSDLREFIML